jgi:hypothetical protein
LDVYIIARRRPFARLYEFDHLILVETQEPGYLYAGEYALFCPGIDS